MARILRPCIPQSQSALGKGLRKLLGDQHESKRLSEESSKIITLWKTSGVSHDLLTFLDRFPHNEDNQSKDLVLFVMQWMGSNPKSVLPSKLSERRKLCRVLAAEAHESLNFLHDKSDIIRQIALWRLERGL